MTDHQNSSADIVEVPIRRDWIEHVIRVLQGDLPSGRVGDAVFLLRDQLQDILDKPVTRTDVAQVAMVPVAWRYRHKTWDDGTWRCVSVPISFHDDPNWIIQPLCPPSQPSPAATVETKHKPDMCPTCGINRNSPFPCEHPRSPAGSASAWRVCWVSLNTSRTELFEDHDKATTKARETGGCTIPLYTAEPQRDMTKWPDTLRFDDRDKYIDELEAQIERLRAVPAVSDKDLLNWIENEASRGLSEGDAREALTAIKWKIKDGR